MEETKDRVSIDLASEIASYNIEGKWNDYIGVQKNVIETLRNENFFGNNTVTNDDSGMVIKITAKGIKETLGTGKRFQSLPRKLNELKVATLRYLPDIIKTGVVLHDNVENYYSKNGDLFTYIESDIVINTSIYGVRVSVKKKVGSNVFWIHHIDTKKDFDLLDPSRKKEFKENRNPKVIIAHNKGESKEKVPFSFNQC